jgi:hypothetical protein
VEAIVGEALVSSSLRECRFVRWPSPSHPDDLIVCALMEPQFASPRALLLKIAFICCGEARHTRTNPAGITKQ